MFLKYRSWKMVDWSMAGFIIVYHIIVFIGLPIYLYYRTPSLGLVLITIALFFATGMSITAGYHRLYSHVAYRANVFVQGMLLLFGAMAMQSSVIYWAHKHRLHHRFVDSENDPHNIKVGFWYAHIGWLLEKQIPVDEILVPDLMKNKLVVFQHKYFRYITFGANLVVFLLLGWAFNDYWGAFVIGWATRVFFLNNSTFFVNSLAHTWGSRVFSREHTAVNNAVVAFLTFGEGYHNYHHVFPSDYRNGVRWYQYDPTKWLIWITQKMGWTKELKKIDNFTSMNTAIAEDSKVFLAAIEEGAVEKKEEYRQKIMSLGESLKNQLSKLKDCHTAMNNLKEKKLGKELRDMKREFKRTKKEFKELWSSWLTFTKELMRIPEVSRLVTDHQYHH